MKNVFSILLAVVFLCGALHAQELNRRMKVDSLFESTKVNPEPDKAYLLVRSQVPNLKFESNRSIDKANQLSSGDWDVWLPAGTHILKIDAPGFQRLEIPARPYARKRSYELVISAVGFAPPDRSDENLIDLTFRCSEDSVYSSYGDFAPVLTRGKTISYKLPQGDYTFRFQKEGFADESKSVTLSQSQAIDIAMKPGAMSHKLSLPGIVQIKSDPTGAEILLNGQKIGNTPYQGELTAGNHQLELRKPFYYPDASAFALQEGKTETITRTLKPRFGWLTVTTTPDSGEILLDGKPIGSAPIHRRQIESGDHAIRIDMPLYHGYSENFSVKDGEEKTMSPALQPAFGSLEITSEPESGAQVYLDGKLAGVTPYANARTPSGKYLLKVTRELYGDHEEQIVVSDNQPAKIAVTMNKNFGELNIQARGGAIFVNAKQVGTESYTGKLPPGTYTVRAERDERYYPSEKEITLAVGEKKDLDLTPQPRLGSASIMVEPTEASDAEIIVNDSSRGNAPLVLPLIIGEYSIIARKANFLDVNDKFTIRENEKQTVRLNMLTYEGSRQQSIDAWSKTKWGGVIASVLSAGAAGYFYSAAHSEYDNYRNATTTDAAVSYRESTNNKNMYYKIALGAVGVSLATTLYAWIRQSSY